MATLGATKDVDIAPSPEAFNLAMVAVLRSIAAQDHALGDSDSLEFPGDRLIRNSLPRAALRADDSPWPPRHHAVGFRHTGRTGIRTPRARCGGDDADRPSFPRRSREDLIERNARPADRRISSTSPSWVPSRRVRAAARSPSGQPRAGGTGLPRHDPNQGLARHCRRLSPPDSPPPRRPTPRARRGSSSTARTRGRAASRESSRS